MNATVMILAQYSENRNWEDLSKPKIWRPKGAMWFKVEVDMYDLLYSEAEAILTEMVAAKSTDTWKYEYLKHHEILGKIETLSTDEFARINERLHEEAPMPKEVDNDMDPAGGYGLHSHE
tara:strand:- start:7 stop:366 length:360 start_codon:yes stop_codon:yes gene_type:complete